MCIKKHTSPKVEKAGRKERFLRLLRDGATWQEASKSAGVCERTALRWAQDDPVLAEALAEAREARIAEVEEVAYRLCLDPDARFNSLRVFFLKSRAGWSEGEAEHGAEARPVGIDPRVAEAAIAAAIGAAEAIEDRGTGELAGGDEPRRRPRRPARQR